MELTFTIDLFVPRMTKCGIILLHDYFNDLLPGVKRAVDQFEFENDQFKQFLKISIGDGSSLAIVVNSEC